MKSTPTNVRRAAATRTLGENEVYMVLVPHFWGKGDTIDEALDRLYKAGGRVTSGAHVFVVHKDSTVDDMGYIEYPKGAASPINLARFSAC